MKEIKLEYQKQKISRSELSLFEKNFDLELPSDYKTFILKNNGGVPEENFFENEGVESVIKNFYSIKYGASPLENTLTMVYDENILPKYFFPFGSNRGGSNFVLSLRKEDFGAVFIFLHDGSDPFKLTNSFEEFLDSLEEDPIGFL